MTYIIAYDIGTTGVKTCLFEVDQSIKLVKSESKGYPLYIIKGGGAEQDEEDWWNAMAESTKALLADLKIKSSEISGISFCSQMQGLVLVDRDGIPVHRPMSYMDQRAREEIRKGIANGIQVGGANIFKLISSLRITGAVSSSVKDPVWKYKWIEAHETENFSRAYKWLDVKDYLICRCTGRFTMTEDSAFATLLYDTRPGREGWSKKICSMFDVNMDHLPEIIKSTDMVGGLTEKAADDLGLEEGIPVFGGGGDSSLIGIGAGAVRVGDTHIYSGTSGWVITVTDRQMVDVSSMIAAITGAISGKFNYFAEMETAGKCLEWVKDHLALDEIGIYIKKEGVPSDYEVKYTSLYTYMTEVIQDVAPGSGGVIFTPWLHGNRCPFEDPDAKGMFFGIGLNTGKTEMIRAVLEGVFYHLRWMLECQDKKIKTSDPVRFVGGGALSPVSCQMLADITGRTIETVAYPQNVGAVGAAAVAATGLGVIPAIESVRKFIKVMRTYYPDADVHRKYEHYYAIFKRLHSANRKLYKELSIQAGQNDD